MYSITMMESKQYTNQDEPEIGLLREWLPKIGVENRAFIKGAVKALLYIQETQRKTVRASKGG
jgi:hypothetical protein